MSDNSTRNSRIRQLITENPTMIARWRKVLNELMYEGFGDTTIYDINIPLIPDDRPKMTQREREERQRFMDEAAGM